jgi:hypothetical protein
MRGGAERAYHWRGGGNREAWWKEREGKKEGMVFWRCFVMGEESVGGESLALGEGNLVSGCWIQILEGEKRWKRIQT